MNKNKENRGITLIALIITIIVLLILVIVSIQLVMNNGIISKSEYGKDKYSEEEIGEQLKLAYAEYEIAKYDSSFNVQQRLQQIYGESTTAEIKNGKLNAKINGVDYRYNSKTGKAGKYVDPINYGTKTKETIEPGDDILL